MSKKKNNPLLPPLLILSLITLVLLLNNSQPSASAAAIDLSLRVTKATKTALNGQTVVYKLRAFNNDRQVIALGVQTKTTIPDGLSFLGDQDKNCHQEGQQVICDFFAIRPQKAKFRTLYFSIERCVRKAILPSIVQAGQSIDANQADNSVSHTIAIDCLPVAVIPASHQLIKVTSLAAEGPGTLNAALHTAGKKIIVFDIGGIIDLRGANTAHRPYKDLESRYPNTIIAGETAPSPGITIIGAGLRIMASNTLVRHLRIRVGNDPGTNLETANALSVIGLPAQPVENILIENMSLSWAPDQNASIWFPKEPQYLIGTVSNVTFRNVIFSEGLRYSGRTTAFSQPAEHSHGLLISRGATRVVIERSLFAHNFKRNPWISDDSTALIINNLIYNPANQVITIAGDGTGGAQVSAIGNLIVPGPDTQTTILGQDPAQPNIKGRLMWVSDAAEAGTKIYLKDNQLLGRGFDWDVSDLTAYRFGDPQSAVPVTWRPLSDFTIIPSAQVLEKVLNSVGARPWDLDDIDERIKDESRRRRGKIIDSHTAVGGFPRFTPITRSFRLRSLQVIPGEFITAK